MFAQTLRADNSTNNQNSEQHAGPIARWCEDWGNCVLVGLAVYLVIYLVWMSAGWGSDRTLELVVEFGLIPVLMLGVLFSIRAIRATRAVRQLQQAWVLIGTGIVALIVADGIWGWYTVATTSAPFPSIADAFYIVSKVAIIAGLLRFPAPQLSRSDYIRYALDAGIITLGVSAMVGYLIIGPENLLRQTIDVESLLLFIYPLLGLLLLIIVLMKMHRRPRPGSVGLLSLIVVSALAMTASDFLWVISEASGTYVSGGISYTLWMIGYAFLVASPQRQVDIVRRNVPLTYPSTFAAWTRSAFSYLAAGVSIMIFLVAAAPRLIDQFGVLLILLILLVILVGLRQIQVLRDNKQYEIAQVRHESDDRLKALVEYSSDMIAVLDDDLRFRFQSPASQELVGEPPSAFVGTELLDWAYPDDKDLVFNAVRRLLHQEVPDTRFEWRLITPTGNVFELESIASNELENPGLQGIVLNSRDISERKQFERELAHQAYHDPLTGLPNRARMLETLEQELRQTGSERKTAVLFIDLDRFKEVNDSLGHDAGDDLLNQVAERLSQVLRSNDMLSRIAGDEFVVLLPAAGSQDSVLSIAQRVNEQLETPFELAGTMVSISSSVGVVIADTPDLSARLTLHRADAAMYAAKRNGRNRVEFFEPWMEDEMLTLRHQTKHE